VNVVPTPPPPPPLQDRAPSPGASLRSSQSSVLSDATERQVLELMGAGLTRDVARSLVAVGVGSLGALKAAPMQILIPEVDQYRSVKGWGPLSRIQQAVIESCAEFVSPLSEEAVRAADAEREAATTAAAGGW
jgi:hypothetical protein